MWCCRGDVGPWAPVSIRPASRGGVGFGVGSVVRVGAMPALGPVVLGPLVGSLAPGSWVSGSWAPGSWSPGSSWAPGPWAPGSDLAWAKEDPDPMFSDDVQRRDFFVRGDEVRGDRGSSCRQCNSSSSREEFFTSPVLEEGARLGNNPIKEETDKTKRGRRRHGGGENTSLLKLKGVNSCVVGEREEDPPKKIRQKFKFSDCEGLEKSGYASGSSSNASSSTEVSSADQGEFISSSEITSPGSLLKGEQKTPEGPPSPEPKKHIHIGVLFVCALFLATVHNVEHITWLSFVLGQQPINRGVWGGVGSTTHFYFLMSCGLMKSGTTIFKYWGQVSLNWERQSTVGLAAVSIVADLFGGFCDLGQLGMEGVG